ncbi:MAG: hypothetical protein LBJ00_03175 [Planctomycetaceae bacterium]|nr:hypothetical protein [Planctomycetaceae bacterium]
MNKFILNNFSHFSLLIISNSVETVAGRAIGFALEQPLHVVTLACSASRIEYNNQPNSK